MSQKGLPKRDGVASLVDTKFWEPKEPGARKGSVSLREVCLISRTGESRPRLRSVLKMVAALLYLAYSFLKTFPLALRLPSSLRIFFDTSGFSFSLFVDAGVKVTRRSPLTSPRFLLILPVVC